MKNNIVLEAFVITILEGIAGGIAQSMTNGNITLTALAAAVAGVIGVLFFHWDEVVENVDLGEIIRSILILVATLALVLFVLSKAAKEYGDKKQIQEGFKNIEQALDKERVQKQKFENFREQITHNKYNAGKIRFAFYESNGDQDFQYMTIRGQYSFFGLSFQEKTDYPCKFNNEEYTSLMRRISSSLFTNGGNHYWKLFKNQYEVGYNEEPKFIRLNNCMGFFWDKPRRQVLFLGDNYYSVDRDSVLFDVLSFDYTMKNLK